MAQSDEDCMMCHEDPDLRGMLQGRDVAMFIDTLVFEGTVHQNNTCISCHADAADEGFPHPDDLKPVNCGSCHTRAMNDNTRGIH